MGCCKTCFSSESYSIIIMGVIALILIELIKDDGCKEYIGNTLLSIGQLLITAGSIPGCTSQGCLNREMGYYV